MHHWFISHLLVLSSSLASLTLSIWLRLWFDWVGSERSCKDIRSGGVLLGIQMLSFKVIKVLPNIGGLPVKELEDVIEGCNS